MRIFVNLTALATLFASTAVAAPVPKDTKPTAKEVLAAAEESVAAIQDLPTRAEYTAAIAAEYALCGETGKANKLFAAAVLHYKAAKSLVFTNVPWRMAEAGMGKDGLTMLDDLSKSDPARAENMRANVCDVFARTGDLKQMEEIRKLLPNGGGEWAAHEAARAYLAAGEFDKAEKAYKEVNDPYWRVELLGLRAVAYQRAGKNEPAEKALKAMVELTDKVAADVPDADKRTELAVQVARAKLAVAPADQRAEARKDLFAKIAEYKERQRQGYEWRAVVDDDLAAGDVTAATTAAEACGGRGWKDRCLLRIADYHLAKGEVEKLAKLVGGMKSPYWQARGRLRLAVALGNRGKAAEAVKQIALAEKVVGAFGDGYRPTGDEDAPGEGSMPLGPEFARAWVAAGEAEGQMAAAQKLEQPYQQTHRLLTLAKGFRKPTREERGW